MFAALNFFFARQGISPTFGALWVWGSNNVGQLGLGNLTPYSSPKQVGSLTTWASLAAAGSGGNMVLAVKDDNTLWSWGSNYWGNLGLGTSGAGTYKSSPTQVGALTNWAKNNSYIIVYASDCFATKTDGTLWSWGQGGNSGMLGLGNLTAYSSPKQVGALTNWGLVGQFSSGGFGVKTNGTLWSWGYNGSGALGLGNLTSYSSPKQVGSLTTWASVSCPYSGVLALKTDGTIWSWGGASVGELGLGNTTSYSSPKQIGSLTNWLNISAGMYNGFAVSTTNALWVWGRGTQGQLGLGNTTSYSSPKQVGSLTNWLKGGSGSNASNAAHFIKTNNQLWVTGENAQGQSGLGNITSYSSPKQVGSLATWLTSRDGDGFSIGIKY
jgi:alpha-tubulin suppressor-like RCC1 family protein